MATQLPVSKRTQGDWRERRLRIAIIKRKKSYRFPERNISVLGIESSCDDTSAAVVNDSGNILGEGHFSQSRIHVQAGGIIPSFAANLHRQFIKNMVDTAIKQSTVNFKDLSAIAVTVKPGLILSLEAGVEFAKDLCTLYSKPMIPIHHMEAHALTARMTDDVKFPFLVFLISGGHCILGLAKSVGEFFTLGSALDSPPGNILDKIARKAKLKNIKKYQGLVSGAAIEKAAQMGDPFKYQFEKNVMHLHGKNCNFSFSLFLKTSQHHIDKEEEKLRLGPDQVIPNINDLCAGILMSMARHFCQRLEVAFHYVKMKGLLKDNERCLVVSGGVASNKFFQKALRSVCEHYDYRMVVPPDKLCTDNGAMVAWNGVERFRENFNIVRPENLSSVTQSARSPFGVDISKDVINMGKLMEFKFMKLDNLSFGDSCDIRSETVEKV